MKTLTNESRTTQRYGTQQTHGQEHPVQTAVPMYTHEDIARRAYEIYVEKGCQQGQSEQNWLQAEQELKNQQHWLQAKQK